MGAPRQVLKVERGPQGKATCHLQTLGNGKPGPERHSQEEARKCCDPAPLVQSQDKRRHGAPATNMARKTRGLMNSFVPMNSTTWVK